MILSQQLERVVFALCEDTNSPRSLTVWLMVKHQEFGQLVNLTTDPRHYLTASRFREDSVVTGFLRKCQGLTIPGIDKEKAARDSFLESEAHCAKTNIRLARILNNSDQELLDAPIWSVVDWMRREVSRILGRLPDDLGNCRFGPGATFADRGHLTTIPDKMSSSPTMTAPCAVFFPLWDRTAWARSLWEAPFKGPIVVRGNRFTSVPKDATKDRGIAIEPSMNVWFQLGVGSEIRARLRRTGIDLNEGQPVHRALARQASRTGLAATIDLSSASDTVCKNLVRLLLPTDWFEVLDSLRSPLTLVDGNWYHLQKFSSMGNGFTFELETLIFLVICRAGCHFSGTNPGMGVHVYGDDLIVPTQSADTILSFLKYFGFIPNPKKTFLSGTFRESCGGDYFDGVDVRPFFLKELPDEPQKWITLANGLRRIGETYPDAIFDHSSWARARARALEALPTSIRVLRGPPSLGDSVITELDPARWRSHRSRDGRTKLKCYLPVALKLPFHHWKPSVVLASALYGVPSDGVTPRGSVSGYAVKWVRIPG